MTMRRPPVIPEIVKAYQNDPRTQLAVQALAQGSSASPVAQGKYGIADGIARVLTGLGGAVLTKKQMDRYAGESAQLIADRKAALQDPLSGNAPSPPQPPGPLAAPTAPAPIPAAPPVPVQVPPQAAAAAAALGAPPPAVAPPGGPQAGGGPARRPPFGRSPASAGGSPSFLAAPTADPVPDAPAPVEKPVRPQAEGPTRSRLLDAAYRIIGIGNEYDSDRGQEFLKEGLSDQTALDEKAAERRQRLTDAEYDTDRGVYAAASQQDRQAKYASREATVEHNRKLMDDYVGRQFQYGVHKEDQAFEARQKSLDRANAMAVAKVRATSSYSGSMELTPEEREALSQAARDGRVDIKGVTKFQAKVLAQSLVDNPGLNAVQLHARAVLAANPAAQRQAMTVQILPDVVNNVRNAGKKLNYSDMKFAGKVEAWAKGQFNDPDFVNYMTQRNDALLTIAQVMRGTGATDMSTKMEAEAAHPTMSPRALDAWYNAQITALLPRARIAEQRGLLDPGTADALAKAHGGVNAPAKTPTVSNW
jgi:hypothetical protein